jgi:polysaccharide pyruvyl transferase WcaK-like protein
LRILIDPGSYSCLNMGDVAMLQVAVRRLHALWPAASIDVVTDAPERLATYCFGTVPVPASGRRAWFNDKYLFGPLHRVLPQSFSNRLLTVARILRVRNPSLAGRILRWEMKALGLEVEPLSKFLESLNHADLVVVSGQGGLCDAFGGHALNVLDTLAIAARRGTPTAFFSQGLGPANDPRLRARMNEILPLAALIALREDKTGPLVFDPRMRSTIRLIITGDDAIELAYEAQTAQLGSGIGVNLRIASYAGIEHQHLEPIRQALNGASRKYGAPLLPVPISFDASTSDLENARNLLEGSISPSEWSRAWDGPLSVIQQAGRCRIVVTGSYHAAVFALSQGVATVCLAGSEYYANKFAGLANQFGEGCEIITPDPVGSVTEIGAAIERAWTGAQSARPRLLAAAARQVEMSRRAYRQLHDQFTGSASHAMQLDPAATA